MKMVFILISACVILFSADTGSTQTVINFDDYTTSGASALPDPPGTYAGFIWEHVDGDNGEARVVSDSTLAGWGCSRNSPSGDYQLYVSGVNAMITVTPASGGSFDFLEAKFARYCVYGATSISLTGHVSGGGTVSHTVSPSNSYQTFAYADMTNLTSLDINGGSGGASNRLWLVDDFTVALGAPAGEVPVSDSAPGSPMTVTKYGTDSIMLIWDQSCIASDSDYAVYEGVLGSYTSHLPVTCSTSGALSYDFVPSGGLTYYLVVPLSSSNEGSYGKDSSDAERSSSGSACLPQDIEPCPIKNTDINPVMIVFHQEE